MTKRKSDLRKVKLRHGLEEVSLPLHKHKQLAALTVLENEVQFSVRLESVAQLHDEWMRYLLLITFNICSKTFYFVPRIFLSALVCTVSF
jgi:hypothetical protein